VPSLCYLEYGLSRINSYALPFYKKLIEVGIIHTESKSLAKFIESIWDDVDMWWNEPNVAYERKRFVCEFAKKCDYPNQYLLSILNNK
jgi:putative transferase (TIGR04331 family)